MYILKNIYQWECNLNKSERTKRLSNIRNWKGDSLCRNCVIVNIFTYKIKGVSMILVCKDSIIWPLYVIDLNGTLCTNRKKSLKEVSWTNNHFTLWPATCMNRLTGSSIPSICVVFVWILYLNLQEQGDASTLPIQYYSWRQIVRVLPVWNNGLPGSKFSQCQCNPLRTCYHIPKRKHPRTRTFVIWMRRGPVLPKSEVQVVHDKFSTFLCLVQNN